MSEYEEQKQDQYAGFVERWEAKELTTKLNNMSKVTLKIKSIGGSVAQSLFIADICAQLVKQGVEVVAEVSFENVQERIVRDCDFSRF